MSLDADKIIAFVREHFATALVVGVVCVPSVWLAAERVLGARVDALKERIAHLESLKGRVKELEDEVAVLKEINKRRDEVVPTRVAFDPNDLYTPSKLVEQGAK
jgi:hypothetical protein